MTTGALRAGAGPAPREENAAAAVRFLFHVTGDGLIDDIVAYWDNVAWKKQLGCLEVD